MVRRDALSNFLFPKYFFPKRKRLAGRGKFLINRPRYFLPQIDKALPPRRNLIPAIFSLSLFFPSFFSILPRRKDESLLRSRLYEDVSYGGSLLGFSLALAFFAQVDRFAPKVGCDVRHEKFSPMQFLQLVNSSPLHRPLHLPPQRRG